MAFSEYMNFITANYEKQIFWQICQISKKISIYKVFNLQIKLTILWLLSQLYSKLPICECQTKFWPNYKKNLRMIKSVQIWTLLSGNQKPKLKKPSLRFWDQVCTTTSNQISHLMIFTLLLILNYRPGNSLFLLGLLENHTICLDCHQLIAS